MSRQRSILRWSVLAVFLITAVTLAQTRTQAVTDEQQAKLDQIDKYIENLSQEVKYNSAINLAELQDLRAGKIRLIDVPDKDLYVQAGFVGWAEYTEAVLNLRGVDLRDDPQFVHTFRDFRGNLPFFKRSDLAPRLLAIARTRLAEDENRSLRGYDAAVLQIERSRDYALNVELPQLREQLKNSVLNPPQAKPAGLVTGIVYSNKPAAIVGGQVVYTGDSIGSVKVAKIESGAVGFEKAGRNWTQKIGEAPSSLW